MDLVIPFGALVIPFGAVSPEHVLTVLVEETENYTVVIGHEEALYEGNMPGCFISLWPGGHLRRLSFGRLLCTCGQQ